MSTDLQQRIYTVSELTVEIREVLEERFPMVWITGEISNFRMPASRHYYFTLKDARCQLSAVMFRGQNRNLKFTPEDGMNITGLGRISLYEPRGTYQIIFEYLEPRGVGALQVAFEQLKNRLMADGLFDEKHKKPIPFLPRNIGIVTSGTGAVVHDILKVVNRRFPDVRIDIVPVRVQGDGSAEEIADALDLLNRRGDADVIILARGGGSLEDLQSFNSETVARAVFASDIPVISGVGHETDVTIADFVADLRAPTPSAAAEQAVPVKVELAERCSSLTMTLIGRFYRYLEQHRRTLDSFSRRLVHPTRRIDEFRLRVDDLSDRMARQMQRLIRDRRDHLGWRTEKLHSSSPVVQIRKLLEKTDSLTGMLCHRLDTACRDNRARLRELTARLHALDPEAVLARGYSIALTVPDESVVRDAASVAEDQLLDIRVARGRIRCRIEGKTTHDDNKTDL